MADFLEETLTQLGFRRGEASTLTVHADLQSRPRTAAVDVELSGAPTPAWLAARAEIAGASDTARAAAERTIALITVPARFAALRQKGEITAVALGVVSRGMLLIEAVATHKDARRQGGGAAVTGALMDWAEDLGITHAALQVLADNDAAIRLYRRLGFTRELYRYCYRQR
jgi:ribosomal protein S18 acetylase RimI-like enzyme